MKTANSFQNSQSKRKKLKKIKKRTHYQLMQIFNLVEKEKIKIHILNALSV